MATPCSSPISMPKAKPAGSKSLAGQPTDSRSGTILRPPSTYYRPRTTNFPPLPSPITIYTDGACSGNPGPSGYGAVLLSGDKRRELSAGYRLTTNNRMELLAVIVALETLRQPSEVTVLSDSQYVVKAINDRWLSGWIKRGWKKSNKKPVENIDLWKRLIPQLERHEMTFRWVRGHSDVPENERCDALAVAATSGDDLAVDEAFERSRA